MDLKEQVFPIFKNWVDTMAQPVPMKHAKNLGRYFIANHIPATAVDCRGEIYEAFEDISVYADTHTALHKAQMSEADRIRCENMETLAKGIVWAIEHDGFDVVKYEAFGEYGPDIMQFRGAEAPYK